ncbi:uncharacterized protein TRAVEDRAFT_69173 [Trametes versicolor FP-101664 SS1]|uniref:uncharacterized protein n=1 Tax=Trametes versicolor (strain FP-101664) TaxID=717944 RepID=UPI0004622A59|nr:uncharacterized protein TRAVEDRAFT_69173 [Trametes versicolor FP-101664 SS1]EIW63013.1 hypothetical protein TRAVEDRAFT_69173 [Trametes versicolor FP-101664 SS1]
MARHRRRCSPRLSRRSRVFIYVTIFCVLLCALFTGAFLIAGLVRSNLGKIIDRAAEGGNGLALLGHAYDVDLPSRQVQISWLILGCGTFASTVGTYDSTNCGRLNTAADFYFDGAQASIFSYDPDTSLLHRNDTDGLFYVQATVELQTEHLLEVTAWYGQDQQYAYPFDEYVLDTYFQALDPATNTSLPTLFVRIADATNNLQPQLGRIGNAQIHTNKPIVDNSTATAGFGVQYVFHRTVLSQLFVVVLFVVNWLLTAVVVYIAVSAYEGLPLSEGVLFLPVSVILTIPALRALWVGAPDFGLLLDSCGTFVQMVIVSLASIYLVVNVGLRRPQEAKDAAAGAHAQHDSEKEAGVPLLPDYH